MDGQISTKLRVFSDEYELGSDPTTRTAEVFRPEVRIPVKSRVNVP